MTTKIFGTHEADTIAQINRCVAAGGVRGVLCRLPQVLDAHAGTIRILHTLRPLGVAMAGHDIYDPYKD